MMSRLSGLALGALALSVVLLGPRPASALEVKNTRACYGPYGATRTDNKFLPGDVLFMHYDIDGLTVAKGRVSYYSELEFYDAKNNRVHSKKNEIQNLIPDLGGTSFPGLLNAIMGDDQKPGKYTLKLKIVDQNSKKTAEYSYPFELLPRSFGTIRVMAPAFGVPGGEYAVQFALLELPLDAKGNPNVDVTMKILEEGSKTELSKPAVLNFPKHLPDDTNLKERNLVPVLFPIYLNRAGRFTIEVDIDEKQKGKKTKLRFPLTVLDMK
jgi:hypothetical protein